MAMLQQRRAAFLLLILSSAGARAEDAPASTTAVQSLRGSSAQAGARGWSAEVPAAAAAPDVVSQSEQVPDYRYFCKHDPDAKSYYSNCSTCVGEVLCCDANQAVASDKHGSGGKRCTEESYGVVALEKCALQAVPPACPYEFFCKQETDRESYYLKCDESCTDTPICCNTDTATLETDLPDSISGGKRCMEGYPGHVSFSMCQARQLPERCPHEKYQYFCKHDPSKQSHYLNCDTCVDEPICCDVEQADTSQLDSNITGGKRCTKERFGVQDMSKCAGQRVPEACQYRYFCKHDLEKMSYYSTCDTCVDTPICCNMETSTLDTIFNDTRRCYEGSPGHADFSMCENSRFPAACLVSTTTTTSTTSTTTSTATTTTTMTTATTSTTTSTATRTTTMTTATTSTTTSTATTTMTMTTATTSTTSSMTTTSTRSTAKTWAYNFNDLSVGELNGQGGWWVPVHYIAGASRVMRVTESGHDGSLCASYPYSGPGVQNFFWRRFQDQEPLPVSASVTWLAVESDIRLGAWGGHFGLATMTEPDVEGSLCLGFQGDIHGDAQMLLPSGALTEKVRYAGPNRWLRVRLEVDLMASGGRGVATLTASPLGDESGTRTDISKVDLGLASAGGGCMDPSSWNAFAGRFVAATGGLDNIVVSTATWRTLYSVGSYYGDTTPDETTMNGIVSAAGGDIIRRECSSCLDSHKDIYMRRWDMDTYNPYQDLLVNWRGDVGFQSSFKLYSSLTDALKDQNAWTYCNGVGIGFPRDCGPSGYVPWQWISVIRGGRQSSWRFSVLVTK